MNHTLKIKLLMKNGMSELDATKQVLNEMAEKVKSMDTYLVKCQDNVHKLGLSVKFQGCNTSSIQTLNKLWILSSCGLIL